MRFTISPMNSRIATTETRAEQKVHRKSIALTCKNYGRDVFARLVVAEHPEVDDGPVDD